MKSRGSEGWDSAAVCRLTRTPAGAGLSVRQLQYWDRTGLLAARTREKRRKRLYGFEDILRLRIIVHLLHSGLPVQKVRGDIVKSCGSGLIKRRPSGPSSFPHC